jgi:hypothetical protein
MQSGGIKNSIDAIKRFSDDENVILHAIQGNLYIKKQKLLLIFSHFAF